MKLSSRRLPIIIVVIVIVIWIGYMLAIPNFFSDNGAATFGDMFGGLDALFSGLALAGVIYAILLQREDLALQREELKLTREEMKRSADSLAEQAESMAKTTELTVRNTLIAYYTVRLELAVEQQRRGTNTSIPPMLAFNSGSPKDYVTKIEEHIAHITTIIEPDKTYK